MSRCSTQPNVLRPRLEIFAEAVVVFVLAWLEKKIIIIIRKKMNILALL